MMAAPTRGEMTPSLGGNFYKFAVIGLQLANLLKLQTAN